MDVREEVAESLGDGTFAAAAGNAADDLEPALRRGAALAVSFLPDLLTTEVTKVDILEIPKRIGSLHWASDIALQKIYLTTVFRAEIPAEIPAVGSDC